MAFVSNGGWVDGNTADGMRLSLADEYSHIYVYNLRGNQRTAGELSRREGGKIFGSGSRNTVAVFIGIKDPAHAGACQIHYNDIGDYLTREQKLQIVADNTIDSADWQTITPSLTGDWINQRDETFSTWPVIGDKKLTPGAASVFSLFSRGLESGRDAWVYNFSRPLLTRHVELLIDNYNSELSPFAKFAQELAVTKPTDATVADYLGGNPSAADEKRIKWTSTLQSRLARNQSVAFDPSGVRSASYRPFSVQWAYFNDALNHRCGELRAMFPTPNHCNFGMVVMGPRPAAEFAAVMTNRMPDVALFVYTTQFFPRWTYRLAMDDGTLDFTGDDDVDEWGYRRVDNISDQILATYRAAVGEWVSKDDIFYYVYGILHDPGFRSRYAADLKKMLPHIPEPENLDRFQLVAQIGRQLADLHIGYEEVEPYPLDVQLRPGVSASNRETWRVAKMKWKSKTDHSAVVYNAAVTVAGIPNTAHDYMLGSRTALEWLIDRYQVKTDKASGIVNDPNDWCDEHDDPTYIVELIKKVTTVSVQTVELVGQLAGQRGSGRGAEAN